MTRRDKTTTKRRSSNDQRKRARALARAMEAVRTNLQLDTLETRNLDRLDFHEISVATIRSIIEAAFDEGFVAGTEQNKNA